jgi:hypothetical protein
MTDDEKRAVGLFSAWFAFCEAGAICDGEPLQDEQFALHYSGNGASCMVTVGDLRAVCGVLERIRVEHGNGN